MEKSPSFESAPSPEKAAAELLKEKGPKSPEFQAWVEEQEMEAQMINTSRANFELHIRKARIYYLAGYAEEALQDLNDNRQWASAEGPEFLAEVDELMYKMEGGEEI